MPASSIDFYLQDARNNFDAVRPAPIRPDANQIIGQCQPNIHISTNCYYGYHDPRRSENAPVDTDCEMVELPFADEATQQQSTARKRNADDSGYPQSKRPREVRILFTTVLAVLLVCQVCNSETATKLAWETSCCDTCAPQCDEVRLYFRGNGATAFQLQPMFTTPNPQQPRYLSLSHGPYDLNSSELSTMTCKSNSAMSFYLQKYKEKNTLNLRQTRIRDWIQKTWRFSIGVFMAGTCFI